MGHDDMTSGYSISTGFVKLTGCQRDPQNRGVTIYIYTYSNYGKVIEEYNIMGLKLLKD